MDDSSGMMELIAYSSVLCCCCVIFLGLVGGVVYFVMQGQKKSSPSSPAVPSTPSTSAVPASPFGPSSTASISSPFDTPAASVPSGPPPGDVRKTLDGLTAPDQPYLLEVSSAYQYMVRWPSADVHGLGPDYQLQINLDDANRTARFIEINAPASGTPGAASVEVAKNAVREALASVGWRVQ